MNRILRRCKFMQKEGINMKRAKKAKTKKRNLRPAARIFGTKNVGFGKHKKCKEEKTHPSYRRQRRNTSRTDFSFLKESKGKRDIKTSQSGTAKKGVLTAKRI